MRLGIITRHAISNYGSILQAYATEKIFETLGCDVKIINYIRKDEKTENIVKTYANSSNFFKKNKLTRKIYKIIQKKNIEKMDSRFEEFRKEYLNLTEEYNTTEELRKTLKNFDVFCTGSDQVWGKVGNDEFDENYFLNFVDKDKKCISYGASFGKTDLSTSLLNNIKALTDKYEFLLVREDSAKNFLIANGVNNVEQVLDPTLLLSREDWEKIIRNDVKIHKKPYILVYQLHHNKKFENYVRYIQKKLKITVYRVNPSIYFLFKPGKFVYLPTPSEFLNLIKNAEYVLTDSFHGTVFSLIFNKKFIDFLPKTTGTRITSLLNQFGLNERIIDDLENIKILQEDIDYSEVNEILDRDRKKSISLLKGVLDE